MKSFEEYLEEGIIKRITPDKSRASFFLNETKNSFEFLNQIVKTFGIDEKTANIIIKNCYDILMELIRAILLVKGFKASGYFSHEAEISFLKELDFNEVDVDFMNELRYSRNSAVYYGKTNDTLYARNVYNFTLSFYEKLLKILNELL